jgi:DNA processing protein
MDDAASKIGLPAPASPCVIMLSEALRGSGRVNDRGQMAFFETEKARDDVKIFYAGDLTILKRPCVAVVGTREVTEAGKVRTKRLTRELVEAGITVASGLAYGVDTVAHKTAIEVGGKTVAVIGTPLDKSSPSENARLQELIYREHLLVSQFRSGEKTFPFEFSIKK